MPTKRKPRRKKAEPRSVGLAARDTRAAQTNEIAELRDAVDADGGAVVGEYREPFGGTSLLLVTLPIEQVEPTPYQRDASAPHVKRLMNVIEKIGRFLDPIIAVRHEGKYWTPNGNHRLQAMKQLGAKSVTALLIPDAEVAYKILALNTEKAHNLREKSMEVIRMARAMASDAGRRMKESDGAFEFEEPSLLTLGLCYEERGRLSGSAYQSILRRIDSFSDEPIGKALEARRRRADKVLALDDAVSAVVAKLKERGLTSPYLKPFVVARVNPIRFSKSTEFDFDEVIDKALASAKKFNVEKVKPDDVARTGGAPPPPDEQ
jgi:ParB family transcriptional regulator, chromosome partitioning protein